MTTRTRTTTDPSTEPAGSPAPVPAEGPVPGPERTEEPRGGNGLPEDPEAAARAVQGFVSLPPADLDRARAFANGQASAVAAGWDAAQRDDHPLTVWEAIAEVTRAVDAIAKDRTASQGGSYKYRGIDDVFAALHPLLGETGLVIMPGSVREARWETRATAREGGTLNVARLLVQYRVIGPDGTETFGEAWGEGGDSGDKATQKAHSQSYKSFTLQLFSIPTEDSSRDEPDATNPAARPFTADEVSRATAAARAADEAETVEGLAGVRRRALHLLDVPVTFEDGSVMPLALLFDQRRAALEAAAGAQR
jgi:hypothetical protein